MFVLKVLLRFKKSTTKAESFTGRKSENDIRLRKFRFLIEKVKAKHFFSFN